MFQALRQRAQTDSLRHCPGACSETPLEMSPGCRSQLAVQFTWPSAWPSGRERSVCPSTLRSSSPWAEVPDGSYAQRCLPTAPRIQDRAPVSDRQDRAGRRHDLSAWQISLKSNTTAWMLMPVQAVCFKKPGAFHLLSSIPFSCWFSFAQERQSTFHMPVCNRDF